MKTKYGRLGLAVLLMGLFSAPAFAFKNITGYVCQTVYTAQANVWFGNDGYVRVRVYDGPDCAGNYLGTFNYHSTGAANQGYVFTEAERRALFRAMQQASYQDRKINLFTSDDNGIFHSTFYSN